MDNSTFINKDEHPGPEDEVQLEIETVTPETECEGQPNDQLHSLSVNGADEDHSRSTNSPQDYRSQVETISP